MVFASTVLNVGSHTFRCRGTIDHLEMGAIKIRLKVKFGIPFPEMLARVSPRKGEMKGMLVRRTCYFRPINSYHQMPTTYKWASETEREFFRCKPFRLTRHRRSWQNTLPYFEEICFRNEMNDGVVLMRWPRRRGQIMTRLDPNWNTSELRKKSARAISFMPPNTRPLVYRIF